MAVVVKDNKIQEVADKDVDYEIPSWPALVGTHASMVPLSSNAQTQRLFYSARFVNQAMSVKDCEAPLVQSLDPDDPDGLSFEQKFGRRMGARYWDDDSEGTVSAITPDAITVTRPDGSKKNINLYNHFQFNRKTYIHNKPQVQVGDKVGKGQILASSNYTDDSGTVSMGANARVALVPYKGYSMDDAIVISQRFADRMKSQHNYEHSLQKDSNTKFGKEHYAALFPRKFTKEQLETLDDSGMVKPGTVLHKGDPIMLATRPKPVYSNAEHLGKLGKVFKTIRSDAAEVWDHEYPGTVDDVADGKKNRKVFVSADVPMQLGDKLVMRNGQKGIVSKILGDNEMLRSLDGKPFDVLLNPLALPSRVNTATLYEMALGKVAAKQGKPIAVNSYTKPGSSRLREVKDLLKKNGLEAAEEVFDPATGLKLERPVSTGMNYIYKLHHVVASKKSARGNAGYDINEQPMRGGSDAAQAKRLGGLETTAILAKGGYSLLKDGATIRGQKNADYWRAIRQGYKPAEPGTPFVFDKFRAMLNGAGLLARDIGHGTLRLSPLTDRDLESRKPIEVLNGKLVKADTLDAEKDGLFDEKLVSGNRWGKITLEEPMPNPAMEQNICLLLGIKAADMRQVIAGRITLEEARERSKGGRVKSASAGSTQLDKLLALMVNEYKKEGYDLSGMKAQFSETPRYTDGSEVPAEKMNPNAFGGSWTNDGVIYINPNREGPMTFYGQNGTKDPEEFSRAIMAHELAHEIYKNHATDEDKEKVRKAIADEGFTTDYLANGVAPHKMDEEGFAEYMAHKVMNRMSDKDKLEAALDYSGSYEDVKDIFDSLPRHQKELVAPNHPDSFVDSPFTIIREVSPDKNGFVEVYGDPSGGKSAEVSIAVRPEAQGKGIGSSLLEKVIGKAKNMRISKLTYKPDKRNTASIALVRKFKEQPDAEGDTWEEYNLINEGQDQK